MMPLQPDIRGFKFDRRVEHLTAASCVELTCPNCQKMWRVAPYQLLLRFRPSTHLNEVASRFRCKACGFKAKRGHQARWAVFKAETLLRDVQV